jgi:hypothetical protein
MIQKELLNELSKQSDTYRTIAGTLETGKVQVIDVPACRRQVRWEDRVAEAPR